jgi:hypothetical protein
MGFTAAAFAHTAGFGGFTDASGIARGLQAYAGRAVGVMFAIGLLDASIIGAFAVSLSTAYAIGDTFGINHSLHRGVKGAKGFYAVYAALVAVAAIIVVVPGSPLGLLTMGVQTLAGVLLPSATVFLLLLCNDKQVLGPWVNGPKTNAFTAIVIGILVTLSIVLTASVLFPDISAAEIMQIMALCGVAGVVGAGYAAATRRTAGTREDPIDRLGRDTWRMPPLAELTRPVMSTTRKIGMSALRLYLAIAVVLVIVKLVSLALGH